MTERTPFAILPFMKTVGGRIRQVRMLAGQTQAEFAATLTVSRGAVGNWERDQGIKTENLSAIVDKYPVSFDWLAKGRGNQPRDLEFGDRSTSTRPTIQVDEIDAQAGAGAFGVEAPVDQHDGGSVDRIRDRWGLPMSFLGGQLRIRHETSVKVIEVQGDSGYDPQNPGAPGSLFPGDRVIVDTADLRPSPPGPFLVWDGVGLVVKLVEVVRGSRDPARLKLMSRNPSYAPYEATEEEARIVGRVRGRISVM